MSEIKHYVAQINYLPFHESCISIAVTGIEILPFYSKKFKDVNVTRLSNELRCKPKFLDFYIISKFDFQI